MSYRREAESAPVVYDDRTAAGTLSTEGVKRDNNSIRQNGWILEPYLKNPIVTCAHDTNALPIARMVSIGVRDGALRGTMQFATADANPLAECVYQCLRQKMIGAASVSWDPVEWKYASGPGRAPGSIDFISQILLEVAVVPLPSDTDCIITARSRGVDTVPLANWADRLLASRSNNAMGRLQLEALSRAARPARTVHDLSKRPPSDRANAARSKAYDDFRRFGTPIPAAFEPPRTRDERAAIVEGIRRDFSTRGGSVLPDHVEAPLREPGTTRGARVARLQQAIRSTMG